MGLFLQKVGVDFVVIIDVVFSNMPDKKESEKKEKKKSSRPTFSRAAKLAPIGKLTATVRRKFEGQIHEWEWDKRRGENRREI